MKSGFLPHDGVAAIGANGQVGANLECASGSFSGDAGNASIFHDQIGDFAAACATEVRVTTTLAD